MGINVGQDLLQIEIVTELYIVGYIKETGNDRRPFRGAIMSVGNADHCVSYSY